MRSKGSVIPEILLAILLAINYVYVYVVNSLLVMNNLTNALTQAYILTFELILVNIIFMIIYLFISDSFILTSINYVLMSYVLLTNRLGTFTISYLSAIILSIIALIFVNKLLKREDLIYSLGRSRLLYYKLDLSIFLHELVVYFASLSIAVIIYGFMGVSSLSSSGLFLLINTILSVLVITRIRAWMIYPSMLVAFITPLSHIASIPILCYGIMFNEYNTPKEYLIGKSIEDSIYMGDMVATLRYGVPRHVYRVTHSGRVYRGKTWYWYRVPSRMRLLIDMGSLHNRHIMITGASGTGKSLLAKHLAVELYKNLKTQLLIIDPHNEYHIVKKWIREISIIDASNISINPFELGRLSPRGKAHQITELVTAIFRLGPIQRQLLEESIIKTFEEKGIYQEKPETWNKNPPGITDLLITTQKLAEKDELYYKILPYVKILSSNIFSKTTVNLADLLSKPVIITLNNLKSDYLRTLYVNILLQKIIDEMYVGTLKNKLTIIIDEAYMFLSRRIGRELISKLLMESRKYGVGLIIISQQPLSLAEPIIENTSVKITFNITEPRNLDYATRIFSGGDNMKLNIIKSALRNLKSYHYILTINGFNEIFIVTEEHIAQNMYGRVKD
jgi:DNA polymerase III delta prime subunit